MKATLSSSARDNLPDSAFACPEKRLYPHHHADGSLDLPHLRAALSRIGDPSNDQCGKAHLEAHAREAGMGDRKALVPVKATIVDDDAFRLLAIPFGGPIPSKASARGVDLDGEFFTERTDIKPDWFDIRLVDWHHGADPKLGRTVLGKATDLDQDDDGWWVTVWLRHGERRVDLIRRLAEQGGQLFGSSESVPGFVKKAATGEILAWPYVRQTLSTSPQNTLSVLRPLKATLDDYTAEGNAPTASFFADLAQYLDDLALPDPDLAGEGSAKSGRVLAQRNEERLREAYEAIGNGYSDPKRWRAALAALKDVLDELDRYVT